MALEQVQRKFLRRNESARGLFQNCNLLILLCLNYIEIKCPRGVTANEICDHMPPGHTKGWKEVNKVCIDLEKQGMIRKAPHIKPNYWFIDEAGKTFVRDILQNEDTKYTLKICGINLKQIDSYNNHFCHILNPFSGISATATL